MHEISLGYYVETMSVYPYPALWQTLTLSSMKQRLRTEESVPIDVMLKANTQKITPFQGVLLLIDPQTFHFLY